MAADLDPLDDLDAPERDPVVRMPKRMYMAPPSEAPSGAGPRLVLLVAGGGALLGAALGAVGLAIVWATTDAAPAAPRPVARAAPDASTAPPTESFELDADAGVRRAPQGPGPIYETVQQALGRGRTLPAALAAMGVPAGDARAAARALQGLVNMRSLQPDDRVAVMRDPMTRELRRVEFRRGAAQVWAAVKDDAPDAGARGRRGATGGAPGTWHGERVDVVLSTARVALGFRVQGSVADSLRAARVEPEMAARLAEVFPSLALPPRLLGGDVVRAVVDEERLNGQFYRYGRVHGVDYQGAWGHRRGFWVGMGESRGDYFDVDGRTFERAPLHSPVPGARVSSLYNPRRIDPVLHAVKPHNGIDFAAPTGTPVFAAADGVVASVTTAGPSGNAVAVEHPALRVQTGYAHLSRFAPGLRAGRRVRAGELLGHVGSTGRSTGPHLHFATRRNGLFFDPMSMLGVRREIAAEARPLFEARSALIAAELDRASVDGAPLAPPADAGPSGDAGAPPTLPPLEVGGAGVRSDYEAPSGEGEAPLDEGAEAQ